MVVTKTIGPLHLEDLEPHRFEDLVRQLLYDFRPWRDLEATGRAGGDEGFDARAWEAMSPIDVEEADFESETDDIDPASADRQWLIQCKREKAIAPAKLKSYLDELPNVQSERLHGIVFVAACDFSKKARDIFYEATRAAGFMEVKLWGKAEIEDQLFQPKNDHLLFAYFGVSLQVRQRGLKTAVRARLTTKRKAEKFLQGYTPVLIRDASDDRYPYPDPDKSLATVKRRRWKVFRCDGCHHDGIHFTVFRALAYIADDEEHWDYAEGASDTLTSHYDDPWQTEEDDEREAARHAARSAAMQKWDSLADKNKAWLETFIVLPFRSHLRPTCVLSSSKPATLDALARPAMIFAPMASVTYHVVLPFIRDIDGELIAEEAAEAPARCVDAESCCSSSMLWRSRSRPRRAIPSSGSCLTRRKVGRACRP